MSGANSSGGSGSGPEMLAMQAHLGGEAMQAHPDPRSAASFSSWQARMAGSTAGGTGSTPVGSTANTGGAGVGGGELQQLPTAFHRQSGLLSSEQQRAVAAVFHAGGCERGWMGVFP